ncbi:MAG: RNA polymerase sigma factor [Candidatus Latescibacteria bacterium]|nr:RNA polymerase sigma factor [Candidatus Latescibacterota bacterium]
MTEDASLVAAALEGGPEAYVPIIERYKDTLFGVAMGRLGHVHDAEDITQGVLVEGWERLADLRDPARLGPWLRSIAVHRCIDLVRRNGRHAEHSLAGAGDHPDAPAAAGLGQTSDTEPDASLERGELRLQVRQAVAALSPTQRETVSLYYLNGYRLEEVARILEVPAGTVKYRLHAAREKLSERLLTMVEDVLRQDRPSPDFSERVFRMLNLHESPGTDRMAVLEELRRIGEDGVPGVERALDLPHSRSRAWALMAVRISKVPATEKLIELIKRGLQDTNKKVRGYAVRALLRLDAPEKRRCEEFAPLLAAMLFDRSRSVRRFAAVGAGAGEMAYHYPLEVVISARARRRGTRRSAAFWSDAWRESPNTASLRTERSPDPAVKGHRTRSSRNSVADVKGW